MGYVAIPGKTGCNVARSSVTPCEESVTVAVVVPSRAVSVRVCSAKGGPESVAFSHKDDDFECGHRRTDNKRQHKPNWRAADIYRSK